MQPKTFIATTGQGIARASCQPSGDWSVVSALEEMDVRCLAVDPLNPNTIYTGTNEHGVLRSDDRGENWQPAGLSDQNIRAVAVSPTQAGVIYAGVKPPALYVSRDGGKSWTELESFRQMRQGWWFTPAEPGPEYIQAIALSPTDSKVILAGVEFGAVLRSEDGGITWAGHRKGALRDCHTMTFHPTNGEWVYQGGGGGAAFSRDGGQTWSKPRRGLDRLYGWAAVADPARPEVWYTSQSPGPGKAHGDKPAEAYIYRSSGGAAWEKLNGGLPQPLDYMPYALITAPNAPGELYAGLDNGDVWHATAYGDRWQKLPFNLGGIHRTMVMV